MNYTLRLFLFLFFIPPGLSGLCQTNNYDPNQHFSVDELKTDFRFLRSNLEKTHPDLYLYTAKPKLDSFFDSLYKGIVSPLTEMEFYNRITLLNSKIKDGHTMLLPGEKRTDFFNQNAKFFPFYIIVSHNKLYVNMNCSIDTSIKEGAEILGINGMSADSILIYLLTRQIRDGYNQTYPAWILTNYFKEYYSFSFGHDTAFLIKYKNADSVQRTSSVYALSKDSIKFYRQAKYSTRISNGDEKGIILETDKQHAIATLVIKSFDIDLLKSVYKQDFKTMVEKIFIQVHNEHIRDLILDIRNNQGGDFEPGRILLSYLLQQPIKYLENSKEYYIIKPRANNFKGNLYVLTNGGSFSSTAIVSSYLELTNRGIFIGEETAGNKTIISGDPTDFILPNTKIAAEISTVRYRIRSSHNDGHGIVPTYEIKADVDNIIKNKDKLKDFAVRLILKTR